MPTIDQSALAHAQVLMDAFSHRTGLTGEDGDPRSRYLWTDAFAVQTFFGLAHALKDDHYRDRAFHLIEQVHETLGRHHPEDARTGWISGLTETQGRARPTAGGLRIGKRLPESPQGEPMDEYQEWERDGQYFHYLTRWIQALLQAAQEDASAPYADWALDLMQAGGRFIEEDAGRLRLNWKMSVDLSRPLVPSLGAHDPLDGLLCSESLCAMVPGKAPELAGLIEQFQRLCLHRDWRTNDPLGIGGLLLNTAGAAQLVALGRALPASVLPQRLFDDSIFGLTAFSHAPATTWPDAQRLAFRECGLSLGLRALSGMKGRLKAPGLEFDALDPYLPFADDIENFWRSTRGQDVATWEEHLDINAVTLAASLVASRQPDAFAFIAGTDHGE